MFLQNALYGLPIWLCVVLAVVPPLTVIVAVTALRRRHVDESGDRASLTALQALLSTAFVFSLTFSVQQLWSDDKAVYEKGSEVVAAVLKVERAIEGVSGVTETDADELFTQFLSLTTADIQNRSLRGDPQVAEALDVVSTALAKWDAELTDDKWPQTDRALAKEGMADLEEARGAWLAAVNGLGIPDVIWINIMLLGLAFVGVMAWQPPSGRPRTSFVIVALSGLVVGLFQIPLFVLNSAQFAQTVARDVFDEFTGVQASAVGFWTGVASFVIIGALFWLVLDRMMSRLPSDADAADTGQNEGRSSASH